MSDFVVTPNEKDVNLRLEHLENIVTKMNNKLEKIFDVVVGNETFDQIGLINRLKNLEKEADKLKALKNKLIGAFIVGGAAWTIIWELFKKLISSQ
jgi:UDP-glucose 6-dehydrogenase